MKDGLFQEDKKYLALQEFERFEKDDQFLLVSRLDSIWVRTNAIGMKILGMLKTPMTFKAVGETLSKDYDLPEYLIQESVEPFLKGALKAGFVQEYDESNPQGITSSFCSVEEWLESYPLMTIWLHVTNACQLKCGYCSVASGPEIDRTGELTLEEIASIYENLPEGSDYKTVISGGEPFLRDDFVEIVKICKAHGYTYLTTNGVIENKQLLMDALEYLDEIQISVDGPEESLHDSIRGKGSFKEILSTLECLKDAGYKGLWISTTALKENVQYLTEMLRFAYSHGARGLYVGRLIPSGRSRQKEEIFPSDEQLDKELERVWFAFSTLADFNKKNKDFDFTLRVGRDKLFRTFTGQRIHNCTLGGCGTISIAHNGDVFPCSLLHLEEMKLGNVKEVPFYEILAKGQEKYSHYCVDNLPHCKECAVRYICGGGCLALSYYMDGDLKSRDPECVRNYDNIIYWCWEVGPVFYRPHFTRESLFEPSAEDKAENDGGIT